MKQFEQIPIDELCINTIRTLAMDGVQQAKSGHPGTPMALAPMTYALYTRFMNYNPKNPKWFNRDRFVLSNGHASMLQYAILHLAGYDLPLEELTKFRQWGSMTPGHPENHVTPGVETTTGPLGQGLATAVGMAIAESHLAAKFNTPDIELVDHYTYVICGDGDLMEGVSHEAASMAGHLGLGKLICLYDDNHITIEGKTDLSYSDNVEKRFESYGWQVINIGDNANDLDKISDAISAAKAESGKPTMIIVRTHIGFGSPNLQDTSTVHGAPLGEEEIRLTKKAYGWPEDEKFLVPDQVKNHMQQFIDAGKVKENEWNALYNSYKEKHPELEKNFQTALSGELPAGWDSDIPEFKAEDGAIATRQASGKIINAFASKVPFYAGGSADLSPSTNTLIKSEGYFSKQDRKSRNIPWGVREFAMCTACSGLSLHGGVRPFASTFFVFSDYARPAIRLASLMKLPVIYVMTHDSIGVGEDGPTHQPVEHVASFRIMPNLCLIRPADANETAYAWRAALQRKDGPTMLVLTRQGLPTLDQSKYGSAKGVFKGAYILSKEKGSTPDIILMASGSEVSLILQAQAQLLESGIDARVVSMPSWELFKEQSEDYHKEVLPPAITKRLAVEAGVSTGWHQWTGTEGKIISIDTFGASAPVKTVFGKFGFSVENIVKKAKTL